LLENAGLIPVVKQFQPCIPGGEMESFNDIQTRHGDAGSLKGKDLRSSNPRATYINAIGLAHDPFLMPVGEQEAVLDNYLELLYSGGRSPIKQLPAKYLPLSYYVSPENAYHTNGSPFQGLDTSRPAFVLGGPGMGKTMLRLVLEAKYRLNPDQTLIVTFSRLSIVKENGYETRPGRGLRDFWQPLTRDVATDLFIQVIEQHDFLNNSPEQEQTEKMAGLLQSADGELWRLVDDLLESRNGKLPGRYGLGEYWHRVGRLPVRHVGWTAGLQQWLLELKDARRHQTERESGEAAFCCALSTAKSWGFKQVFVLVDSVDIYFRQTDQMEAVLSPLLQMAIDWHKRGVIFKFFLPEQLASLIKRWTEQFDQDSVKPVMLYLNWPNEKLRQLLQARFLAARSDRVGLSGLVERELVDSIDDMVIREAKGSPRRLLQVVNELINAHVRRNGNGELITLDNWYSALKNPVLADANRSSLNGFNHT
jgi:hypothetical protein